MPLIDEINGVKIRIFSGEHRPPHIHAVYNEYEALIIINNSKLYSGYLPKKQLNIAKVWLKDNREDAEKIFQTLNPQLL